MLKNLMSYYHPATVEDACKLLAQKGHRNVVIAGGTYLTTSKDEKIHGLVDLSKAGLDYINVEVREIVIGAMTPVQDIYKDEELQGASGHLLRAAAGAIGSTLLRNSITIGGNVASVFPWSDLPPALMALDATATIKKGRPKRTVAVEKMIEEGPRKFIDPDEIIKEFQVPVFPAGTGTAFHKFAKTRNDYSMITIAVRLSIKAGKIEDARIALNAITKKPIRHLEAEKTLIGQKPSSEVFANAAAVAARGLSVTNDFRASKEYRLEVLEVYTRRCLESAVAMAEAKPAAKKGAKK